MRIQLVSISLFALLMILMSCGNASSSGNKAIATESQLDKTEVEDTTLVKIITPQGDIIVQLFNQTPLHRDNFIRLVREGFYDGLLFHRVINGFMIQGGDPDSRNAATGVPLGMGDPGYTLPAEIVPGIYHRRGALAAARLGDQMNPERRSSGSQFYIVQGRVWSHEDLTMMAQQRGLTISEQARKIYTTEGGTPHLDYAYTVFGQVTDGFDVIDRIAASQTDRANRPLQDVSMRVVVLD